MELRLIEHEIEDAFAKFLNFNTRELQRCQPARIMFVLFRTKSRHAIAY